MPGRHISARVSDLFRPLETLEVNAIFIECAFSCSNMSNPLLAKNVNYLRAFEQRPPPPVFLAPLSATSFQAQHLRSQFSTSSSFRHRRRKGDNPNRGVSALRRTGLRFAVGMSKYPLPQPVLDPEKRSKIEVDEKHGLWGFFNTKRTLLTEPLEEAKFGMRLSSKCVHVAVAHIVH